MHQKVFIVEDDQTISRLVCQSLCAWGYDARAASDFAAVDRECAAFAPALVLLDISLPYYNGYYWCGQIRKLCDAPIVFISSRAESMDIVTALNMGGDDYITKPFDMNVLLAKIGAMLRRSGDACKTRPFAGDVTIDPAACCAYVKDARVLLTKTECRLLHLLIEKKGAVVPRQDLMLRAWDCDSFIDDNTLSVNINRLRKKLTEAGAAEDVIKTVKGAGYMTDD